MTCLKVLKKINNFININIFTAESKTLIQASHSSSPKFHLDDTVIFAFLFSVNFESAVLFTPPPNKIFF